MNKLSPFRWFVLQNFPFIEADFDALTNYELMCKIVEYLNKTIDKTNELGNQVEVLTNWFNNLDVQDEINNKLDEMAESGELTDIIAQYLQLAGLLCYNSVSDMKSAENLVNGSFARTFGYYSANDGGASLYKIREVTNQDVEDDMFIIALNNPELVAELVVENSELNMEQVGAKNGVSSFDCSPIFEAVIKKALDTKAFSSIFFPSGKFYFLTNLNLNSQGIDFNGLTIHGAGRNYTGNMPGTVLYYFGSNNTYFINFKKISNANFKDLKIVGNGANKCFEINNNCILTNFNNIEFTGFTNHVWIKLYTGYLRFEECTFDNTIDGTEGVIINQHYTDGRTTTGEINSEYIYFIRCNMDAHFHSAKHILIHEASFLYIDQCDLCNTTDTAIYMDSTGWGGILDDIFITNCSFARNKQHIYVETGTGECRGLQITDNHYLRHLQEDTNESIIKIRGNANSKVWYGKITGACDSYANATRALDFEYATYFDVDISGDIYPSRRENSYIRFYNKYRPGTNPDIEYITPNNVTVEGNVITYDLTDSLSDTECCQIAVNGTMNSGGLFISALCLYASRYSAKVASWTGTNISGVTFAQRKIKITCDTFAPSTSLTDIKFIKIK